MLDKNDMKMFKGNDGSYVKRNSRSYRSESY